MLTFSSVYGPGAVYQPRAAPGFHMLRAGDESVRDVFTCVNVTMTGDAPTYCTAAALTPAIRQLIEAAGLPFIPRPLSYRTPEDLRESLREQARAGQRIVFQSAFPSDPELDASYWIPRELLTLLNDKAELSRFVPAAYCAPRRVIPIAEAEAISLASGATIVIKGSTEMSTGSGGAVIIVRQQSDLRGIRDKLGRCERVVVEEFQPFVRTMCLNFAADYAGALHFIGSADQVVTAEGVYVGSWIGPEFEAPGPVVDIARGVMREAMGRGYVGFAGFDVGMLQSGHPIFFDLNFRPCASTPALTWLPEVRRRLGPESHARVFGLERPGAFADLHREAMELVEAGIYLPIGAFDPAHSEWPQRPPAVRGAVIGRNRAETEARCEALIARGLAKG